MKKLVLLALLFLLLFAGCCLSHDWREATCEVPKTCMKCEKTEGEALGHSFTEATCENPEKCERCGKENAPALGHSFTSPTCIEDSSCTVCGKKGDAAFGHSWSSATCVEASTCTVCKAEGDAAKGHSFKDATCTKPKTCSVCSATEGEALGHDWSKATSTKPKTCKLCGKMEPMDMPANGTVFIGGNLSRPSKLTINNSGSACYIKLKNSSKQDVFAFFVRPNKSVTVAVPAGNYYVYFASGDDWYGTKYLFGDDTVYSKDKELLDFTNYTWQYTLKPVTNGNFSQTYIGGGEF